MECLLFPTRWFTRSLKNQERELLAIGQMERSQQGGRFLWMLTTDKAEDNAMQYLIRGITTEAGRRGCLFLHASIDQDSEAVSAFKANGFAQIGWEQAWVWENKGEKNRNQGSAAWRKTKSADLFFIDQLQNKVLSPAEKWITPSVHQSPPEFTLVIDGEIRGFAQLLKNKETAVLIPFYSQSIHPPQQYTEALLSSLSNIFIQLYFLSRGRGIPAGNAMLETYKSATGNRVRMVKHLVVRNEAHEAEKNHITNGSTTDAVTTISKSIVFKDKI